MPIRFRCVYCNQLLGISRRKAGTIVRCTSCEGQLIVPEPSDPAAEAAVQNEPSAPQAEPLPVAAANQPRSPSAVFDNDEFGAFLEPLQVGPGGQAVASAAAPSARRSAAKSQVPPPVPSSAGAPAPALALTRLGLTIAVLLTVLGVGLAFAGGLWLGLSLSAGPPGN